MRGVSPHSFIKFYFLLAISANNYLFSRLNEMETKLVVPDSIHNVDL